jgi:hypothetical protein
MRFNIKTEPIVAGLGLLGVGAPMIWPDQKWIGWLFIGLAAALLLSGIRIDGFAVSVGRAKVSFYAKWIARIVAIACMLALGWLNSFDLNIYGGMLYGFVALLFLGSLVLASEFWIRPIKNNRAGLELLGTEMVARHREILNDYVVWENKRRSANHSTRGGDMESWNRDREMDRQIAMAFEAKYGAVVGLFYTRLQSLEIKTPSPRTVYSSSSIPGIAKYLGVVGSMLGKGQVDQAKALTDKEIWKISN